MTEAEKKAILDNIEICKTLCTPAVRFRTEYTIIGILDIIQKQVELIDTHSESKTSEEEIDDWADAIEARIDRLEQRMAWHESNKLDQLKDVLNR